MFPAVSCCASTKNNWAPSSKFLSSSIPSWQILTAHAQPSRGARDLAFCLKVPLDSLLVWASSGDSGETARMRRLAWTFAARMGDKYQIRLTQPNSCCRIIDTRRLQECESKLFAVHQNGKISTTLAPGQNGFLLYNWEFGFKLDSHLLVKWIKGCLTFPVLFIYFFFFFFFFFFIFFFFFFFMFNAGTE